MVLPPLSCSTRTSRQASFSIAVNDDKKSLDEVMSCPTSSLLVVEIPKFRRFGPYQLIGAKALRGNTGVREHQRCVEAPALLLALARQLSVLLFTQVLSLSESCWSISQIAPVQECEAAAHEEAWAVVGRFLEDHPTSPEAEALNLLPLPRPTVFW